MSKAVRKPKPLKGVPGTLRGRDCVGGATSSTPGLGHPVGAGLGWLVSEGPAKGPGCQLAGPSNPNQVLCKSEGFARITPGIRSNPGRGEAVQSIGGGEGRTGNAEKLNLAIDILRTGEGRAAASESLVGGMLTPGSRATKAGKLRTLVCLAEVAGFELFPLTAEKLNPVLGAMKLAGYRSADSYLQEARLRHTQLGHPVSGELKMYFKDAVRAVVRDRGPPRRAPIVLLETLLEAGVPRDWAHQVSVQCGPAEPWDTFVVACWWMLRGAEVLSLKVAQCSVAPGERARAEVRLGCTKMDIEGVGRRRCFLCICPSGAAADGLCPACALSRLLAGASGGPGANAEKLVRGPAGHEVSHQGLCRAWRAMLAAVPRFDDAGKPVDAEVTEHTARRTGAQFHARRGLALWQIQYVGRWGGNTVEQYVAEAFAEIRADWAMDGSVQREAKRARSDERQEVRLWEVSEELRRLSAAVEDLTGLRAELLKYKTGGGTFPNALCDETMERDLVDEALSEGTFEISAENITRLRHRRSRIHVVNRRSNVVHAVDLDSMASPTSWWSPAGGWRSGWSAACGWKFGSADARLQAGGSVGTRCCKPACAAKFLDIGVVEIDDEDSDDEEEK